MKLRAQGRQLLFQRPGHPRIVHLLYGLFLPAWIDKLGTQVSTLIHVPIAGVQVLAQLPVDPELVAIGINADSFTLGIERHQVGLQVLWNGMFRTFINRPLRQPLLLRENRPSSLHPREHIQPQPVWLDTFGL